MYGDTARSRTQVALPGHLGHFAAPFALQHFNKETNFLVLNIQDKLPAEVGIVALVAVLHILLS